MRWPKRGSLSYSPRKRARSITGRIDYWLEVSEGPQLLGFAGYKAGMTHVFTVEDRDHNPNFGKEVKSAVTVIDAPPMVACAVRAYEMTDEGLKTMTEAWMENPPVDLTRRVKHPAGVSSTEALEKMASELEKTAEFRILTATQPRLSSVPKKKPELMEIKVGGGTKEEQLSYVKGLLGKTINVSDVFKPGEAIDIIGVTKGKGFQGPVKRWGVRILQNKARKTKRGVATLGPWHPARVMPSVPRAGQMGFHGRTEYGKRILILGQDGGRVTPREGFVRYGPVKGDFMLVKGSVMGAPKRLLRLRKAVRKTRYPETAPQVTYVNTEYLKGGEG